MLISEKRHVDGVAGILLLALGPFAVFLIERGPVVVNVFVEIDITDLKRSEHILKLLAGPVTADFEEQKDYESE